jgi:hypothetical protein
MQITEAPDCNLHFATCILHFAIFYCAAGVLLPFAGASANRVPPFCNSGTRLTRDRSLLSGNRSTSQANRFGGLSGSPQISLTRIRGCDVICFLVYF